MRGAGTVPGPASADSIAAAMTHQHCKGKRRDEIQFRCEHLQFPYSFVPTFVL